MPSPSAGLASVFLRERFKMSIKSNRLNNPQIIGLSQFNTLPNYNESVLSEIPMTKRNSVESLSNAPSEIGS